MDNLSQKRLSLPTQLLPSSRRSSLGSSTVASPNRKLSKMENLSVGGGRSVLVQLDEELSLSSLSLKVARKDSLETPNSIGGVLVGTVDDPCDQLNVNKKIKKTIAHHSPDVEVNSDHNEEDLHPDIKSQKSIHAFSSTIKNLRHKFFFFTFHLHLALATPSMVRIPHLVHKYATKEGSAFLIAYFSSLLVVALPLCLLETTMAQYASLSPINLFTFCLPLIKGIGCAMAVVCCLFMFISSCLLAWTCFYLFSSLKSELPWESCPTNTTVSCEELELVYPEASGISFMPSDYFYQMNVLNSLEVEEDDPLTLNITLASILLGIWLFMLFIVARHKVWLMKWVSSFATIITCCSIFSLMVNGLNLEYSGRGLADVFKLNMTYIGYQVKEPDLWLDCMGQAFWALGPCVGLLIGRTSYNNFQKKITSDVVLNVIINLLVTLMLMLTIFPYAGHLYNVAVYDNLGYFFVMSSYAVTQGPLPHVASFMLYAGLFKNLLSHTVMLAETATVSLSDSLPISWRSGLRRFLVDLVVCCIGFLGSLIFVTKEGIYYLTTTETLVPWVAGVSIGFFEVSALMYIYGRKRIRRNFHQMEKSHSSIVFSLQCLLPPILLGFLVWAAAVGIESPISWNHTETSRESSYFTFGLVSSLLPLTTFALVLLVQIALNIHDRKNLKAMIVPLPDWGPALTRHREMLMSNTRKRRDRNKPWLVVQDSEYIPEDITTWIPFGYSWIPDGPNAALLKQGVSLSQEFKIEVANHLIERLSGKRRTLSRSNVREAAKKEQIMQITAEETGLRERKTELDVPKILESRSNRSSFQSVNSISLSQIDETSSEIIQEKNAGSTPHLKKS